MTVEIGRAAAFDLSLVAPNLPPFPCPSGADGSPMSEMEFLRRVTEDNVDLNRNFPASNFRASADRGRAPLDQPESALLHRQIEALRPDLVISTEPMTTG